MGEEGKRLFFSRATEALIITLIELSYQEYYHLQIINGPLPWTFIVSRDDSLKREILSSSFSDRWRASRLTRPYPFHCTIEERKGCHDRRRKREDNNFIRNRRDNA